MNQPLPAVLAAFPPLLPCHMLCAIARGCQRPMALPGPAADPAAAISPEPGLLWELSGECLICPMTFTLSPS